MLHDLARELLTTSSNEASLGPPRCLLGANLPFSTVLGDPPAQGARIDTQVPSHLGDRLARVPDNADRPLLGT
jgi:hypothetical protein